MSTYEPILIEAASILVELNRLCPDADKSIDSQTVSLGIIHNKLAAGWSSADIVAHMKWSEDFNPSVSEAVALRMMALVSSKYPRQGIAV